MLLDSALRMMNRMMVQSVKIFGINSEEYSQLKYLAESIDPNIDLFIRTEENKPIQFSRGKKSLEGMSGVSDDIMKTLQAMRNLGTPLQQIREKYDNTMTSKRMSSELERKRIKTLAMYRAAIRRTVSAWYAAIDDIDDPETQAIARKKFEDTGGLKGDEFYAKADIAIEYVRQALIKQGEEILNNAKKTPEERAAESARGKTEVKSKTQVMGQTQIISTGNTIGDLLRKK